MGAWELNLLYALQGLHCPVLDAVMIAASTLASHALIWLAIAVCLLARRSTRMAGIAVLAAVAAAELAVPLIKGWVMRPRPYMVDRSVALIAPAPGGWSFPSGHATTAFACAGALAASRGTRRGSVWLAGVALAFLVTFSRLYLFVHWPTDVLAGAAIGLMLGWLAARAVACVTEGGSRHGGKSATGGT